MSLLCCGLMKPGRTVVEQEQDQSDRKYTRDLLLMTYPAPHQHSYGKSVTGMQFDKQDRLSIQTEFWGDLDIILEQCCLTLHIEYYTKADCARERGGGVQIEQMLQVRGCVRVPGAHRRQAAEGKGNGALAAPGEGHSARQLAGHVQPRYPPAPPQPSAEPLSRWAPLLWWPPPHLPRAPIMDTTQSDACSWRIALQVLSS